MNKIKELRTAQNQTQEDLAQALKIDVRLIEQYENGASEPSAETLEKIAKHFHVPTSRVSGLPEVSTTLQRMRPSTLADATKIRQEDDVAAVNVLLGEGWKLLHIGEDMKREPSGSGRCYVVYTLGWFGAPQAARDELSTEESLIFL